MTDLELNPEQLNQVGEDFAISLRRGEPVSAAEIAAGYPEEHQAEIREFLESIALLEDLKRDQREGDEQQGGLPDRFGRYTIERSLGEGGMGTVYLAHDAQLNRHVALKTPKFSRKSDQKMVERFYREARAAATLQHPNICPIYDVGEIDGVHYISMAYIQGRPLSDYISARKLTPVASVLRIVRKVALAIHEAHRQGLVHRDLKPANIMISRHNEPIVMDFGLARQFAARQEEVLQTGTPSLSHFDLPSLDAALTLDGTIMGSPAYMAPEQLRADQRLIGPGCDIYALGVVLYELLTFQLPFPGDGSLQSVVQAVLSESPPDASLIRDNLDPSIVSICQKALAKLPADRFRSMEELATALTTVLKSGRRTPPRTMSEVAATVNSPELARSREQYELARSLYQEGQFAAAVSILEKMVSTGKEATGPFRKWAESELPRARARIEQARAETASDLPWQDNLPSAQVVTLDSGRSETLRSTGPVRNRKPRNSSRHRVIAVLASLAILMAVVVVSRSAWKKRSQPAPRSVAGLADSNSESQQTGAGGQEPSEVIDDDNSSGSSGIDVGDEQRTDTTASRRPPGNQRSMLTPAQRLWLLDANEDGKISRLELEAPRGPQSFVFRRILDNFNAFDMRPRDGVLDRFETQRMFRLMRSRDNDASETRRNLN